VQYAVVCASHSPLVSERDAADGAKERYTESMRDVGEWIRAFNPDIVIQFAPDHYNGFFYDVMPSFCIGTSAFAIGDWQGLKGSLNVPTEVALQAVEAVRDADVDVSVSFDMQVDHGFGQFLQMTLGSLIEFPLIPIMINCAAPPMPSFRRSRLLGQAIGRFAKAQGKRALFVGSGGLSHDPPMPVWENADEPQRNFLLRGRNPSAEQRRARENRVRNAALLHSGGHDNVIAPSANWDRRVIELLRDRDLERFDDWQDSDVTRCGGAGGHEIRTWIAAFAAMAEVSPDYEADVRYHEVVAKWLTGMAVVRGS